MSSLSIHYLCYDPSINQSNSLSRYLNQDELLFCGSLKSPKAQSSYITSRALLNICLAETLGLTASEIKTQPDTHGKPEISQPQNCRWHFNISHTLGLTALIIAKDIDVGIDVENNARKNDFLGIAQTYFHKEELHALQDIQNKKKQKDYFFKLWTLKESYLKALSHGLTLPLDSFCYSIDGSKHLLSFKGLINSQHKYIYSESFTLFNQYTCAITMLSQQTTPEDLIVKEYNFKQSPYTTNCIEKLNNHYKLRPNLILTAESKPTYLSP